MFNIHLKCTFTAILLTFAVGSLSWYWLVIDKTNGDLLNFYLPWMEQIRTGGISALSGEFSNYTPPYLYLLWLVTPLHPFMSDIQLVKLVPITFNLLAAGLVFLIVGEITKNYTRAALAGACFLALPTVAFNSAFWGQSDIIYAVPILISVLYSIKNKSSLAVLFFGVALSIKLQAIFVLPFLLYLLLRRNISLLSLGLVPGAYLVAVLPAWLIGRPITDLLQIYLVQMDNFQALSMSAPNLYSFIQRFQLVSYSTGLKIGLVIGSIMSVALAIYCRKIPADARGKLLVVTAAAVIVPFLMPKMHERYFFLGDVLTYVLAFCVPNTWPLAIAMQVGSFSSYGTWFFGWEWGAEFGALATSMTVLGIIIQLRWARIEKMPSGVARSRTDQLAVAAAESEKTR
jgi:Gpi18-like mannosyltransferase